MPTQKHDRPQWNCSEIDDHHHSDDSGRNGAIDEHIGNHIIAEEHTFEPQSLELGERISFDTGGRAPCPSVQNDGGTTGDAANTTNTTKTFGTDPSSQNVPGCVDATDIEDFYNLTLSAGKDFTVELTVPSSADFDLYLVDSNMTILRIL